MNAFRATRLGRKFFNVDVPRIVDAVERIAMVLENRSERDAPRDIRVLHVPLSAAELRERARAGDVLEVIELQLSDLIDWSIDELNDEASERITGSMAGLQDISYRVVGATVQDYGATAAGGVLIEVRGQVVLEDIFPETDR